MIWYDIINKFVLIIMQTFCYYIFYYYYFIIIFNVLNYLDLALRHSQRIGEPRSLRPRQIFSLFKSLFQREYLLSRKRGSRVFPLAILVQQHGVVICNNNNKWY